MSQTDRIEREVVIRASRENVWSAISDADEFGAWFGVKLDEPFFEGQHVTGTILDPPGYEHLTFQVWIEEVKPMHRFSLRWHPFAVDAAYDYDGEPTTLVTFELDDVEDGTRLVLTESGFDKLPEARRGEAFLRNGQGWSIQIERVKKYAEAHE